MKRNWLRYSVSVLAIGAVGVLAGCSDDEESAPPVVDSGSDAKDAVVDSKVNEAAPSDGTVVVPDAAREAAAETATDVGADAPADVTAEAAAEAAVDAPAEAAPDAAVDAPADLGADATVDAVSDTGTTADAKDSAAETGDAGFGDNLVQNAGFESDAGQVGWFNWNGTAALSTAAAHTGTTSLLAAPSGSDKVFVAAYSITNQAASGAFFQVSAWARVASFPVAEAGTDADADADSAASDSDADAATDADSAADAGPVLVPVKFTTKQQCIGADGGTETAAYAQVPGTSAKLESSSWTQVSGSFTLKECPLGFQDVLIYLEGEATGATGVSVYLDDVSLRKKL